mmetsp:Transcript_38276/g.95204  ORF Transcript_38276/g.95204 Transcript_38276/m.95204 type:complete len:226 (+) Transcript_38276:1129-1806(+)
MMSTCVFAQWKLLSIQQRCESMSVRLRRAILARAWACSTRTALSESAESAFAERLGEAETRCVAAILMLSAHSGKEAFFDGRCVCGRRKRMVCSLHLSTITCSGSVSKRTPEASGSCFALFPDSSLAHVRRPGSTRMYRRFHMCGQACAFFSSHPSRSTTTTSSFFSGGASRPADDVALDDGTGEAGTASSGLAALLLAERDCHAGRAFGSCASPEVHCSCSCVK